MTLKQLLNIVALHNTSTIISTTHGQLVPLRHLDALLLTFPSLPLPNTDDIIFCQPELHLCGDMTRDMWHVAEMPHDVSTWRLFLRDRAKKKIVNRDEFISHLVKRSNLTIITILTRLETVSYLNVCFNNSKIAVINKGRTTPEGSEIILGGCPSIIIVS